MVVREIIRLNITQDTADDIDHLANRRVSAPLANLSRPASA